MGITSLCTAYSLQQKKSVKDGLISQIRPLYVCTNPEHLPAGSSSSELGLTKLAAGTQTESHRVLSIQAQTGKSMLAWFGWLSEHMPRGLSSPFALSSEVNTVRPDSHTAFPFKPKISWMVSSYASGCVRINIQHSYICVTSHANYQFWARNRK